MLRRYGGAVKHVSAAFPSHTTLWQDSTISCEQLPTVPSFLTRHLTCSDVAPVLCYKCQERIHQSELFGKALPSNINNAQRPPIACSPGFSHAQMLRRVCETRVSSLPFAQIYSGRLDHSMSTTPNDPFHAHRALNMLSRCRGAVQHVLKAFTPLQLFGKTLPFNVNKPQRSKSPSIHGY